MPNILLDLNLITHAQLYTAYMPFVKNGGLFIATNNTYNLHDEVKFCLYLMDEAKPHALTGKVVWLTPQNAQGGQPAGIGVQLSAADEGLRQKIENYLKDYKEESHVD